jgi:multidrug resistance efflux pump
VNNKNRLGNLSLLTSIILVCFAVGCARTRHAVPRELTLEAEAELAGAEGDVTKFRPLAEIAAISRRDLDKAVAERDAAKERVEAAKDGVKDAQAD